MSASSAAALVVARSAIGIHPDSAAGGAGNARDAISGGDDDECDRGAGKDDELALALRSSESGKDSPLNETQLLVVFLLSQLCRNHDPTPRLFVLNCLRFYELGILPSLNFLADMGMIPPATARLQLPASPSTHDGVASSQTPKDRFDVRGMIERIERETMEFQDHDPLQISMSRYQRDFVEIEPVGKGGFGSVYRARHTLDGVEYAVKKISFAHSGFSAPKQKKVMREVRILARLHHKNVCRYYNSWLEPTWQDSKVMGDAIMGRTKATNDSVALWKGSPSSPEAFYNASSFGTSGTNAAAAFEEQIDITPPALVMNLEKDVEALCAFDFVADANDDDDSNASDAHERLVRVSSSKSISALLDASDRAEPLMFPVDDSGDGDANSKRHLPRRRIARASTEPADSFGVSRGASSLRGGDASSQSKSRFSYVVTLYIQMSLCTGNTLQDWLRARSAAEKDAREEDLEEILTMMEQILCGLHHVHASGIIHRDMKPSNVFFCEDGSLQIGDFGLSKIEQGSGFSGQGAPRVEIEQVKRRGSLSSSYSSQHSDEGAHTRGIGTLSYASPEQVNQKSYDAATDIYSIGLMIMELFCTFGTAMERAAAFRDARSASPQLPSSMEDRFPEIAEYVRRMLSREPLARPSSADILAYIRELQLKIRGSDSPRMTRLKESAQETARLKKRLEELEEELRESRETIKAQNNQIVTLTRRVSELERRSS